MVQEMAKKIAWLGHDAFRIDAAKTVYFDPYEIPGGPKADLILISHDHFDHCDPQAATAVRKETTEMVLTKACTPKLTGGIVIGNGGKCTAGGIPIEARQRIEELFDRVAKGECPAHELEEELNRWGAFQEYQDRFFDVVKGKK